MLRRWLLLSKSITLRYIHKRHFIHFGMHIAVLGSPRHALYSAASVSTLLPTPLQLRVRSIRQAVRETARNARSSPTSKQKCLEDLCLSTPCSRPCGPYLATPPLDISAHVVSTLAGLVVSRSHASQRTLSQYQQR
jgi:hypothetical protein